MCPNSNYFDTACTISWYLHSYQTNPAWSLMQAASVFCRMQKKRGVNLGELIFPRVIFNSNLHSPTCKLFTFRHFKNNPLKQGRSQFWLLEGGGGWGGDKGISPWVSEDDGDSAFIFSLLSLSHFLPISLYTFLPLAIFLSLLLLFSFHFAILLLPDFFFPSKNKTKSKNKNKTVGWLFTQWRHQGEGWDIFPPSQRLFLPPHLYDEK